MESLIVGATWLVLCFVQFSTTWPVNTDVIEYHGIPICEAWNDSDGERLILRKLLSKYHRDTVPVYPGVDVEVELVVQSISHISEISSSFTVDILFSQIWLDPGLSYESLTTCIPNISLGYQMIDKIWHPNVCFVNSKSSSIHESPTPNAFILFFPNGTVWVNYRVKVEAPCDMDFTIFPLDSPKCELVFESYSFNSPKVKLHWKPQNPVVIINRELMKLPEYHVDNIEWRNNTFEYAAGMWDQLTVEFTFKRAYGFYILQMFLPSTVSVLLSFTGFWLDHRTLAGRVTLDVSALMTLSIQYGNVAKALPKVSYVKAIDIWMIFCTAFVFLTMAELALVSVMERRNVPEPRYNRAGSIVAESMYNCRNYSIPRCSVDPPATVLARNWIRLLQGRSASDPAADRSPEKIEAASRILFPLAFSLFNVVFWFLIFHNT